MMVTLVSEVPVDILLLVLKHHNRKYWNVKFSLNYVCKSFSRCETPEWFRASESITRASVDIQVNWFSFVWPIPSPCLRQSRKRLHFLFLKTRLTLWLKWTREGREREKKMKVHGGGAAARGGERSEAAVRRGALLLIAFGSSFSSCLSNSKRKKGKERGWR